MIFEITKTNKVGGGWLVKANHAVSSPEMGTTQPAGMWAFRTLDAARSFIGEVATVEKRVRMTKLTNDHYIYRS